MQHPRIREHLTSLRHRLIRSGRVVALSVMCMAVALATSAALELPATAAEQDDLVNVTGFEQVADSEASATEGTDGEATSTGDTEDETPETDAGDTPVDGTGNKEQTNPESNGNPSGGATQGDQTPEDASDGTENNAATNPSTQSEPSDAAAKQPTAETETSDAATEESTAARAGVDDTHIDGGDIPDSNLTWEVTENDAGDRTLIIAGEGEIPNLANLSVQPPYYSYITNSSSPIKLVIEDGITRIGNNAFHNGCFTSIDFGTTVSEIGTYAFSRITLTERELIIPGNVKTLKRNAFELSHLGKITFMEGVETLGQQVFNDAGIDSKTAEEGVVNIPASLVNFGAQPFYTVYSFEVDPDNPVLCDIDGVLYSKDGSTLIDYPNFHAGDSYTPPESVRKVAQSALKNTRYLKRVTIPSTVKTMTYDVFRDSSVEEVYIADGVSIDGGDLNMVFYGASSLRTIRFPEDVPLRFDKGPFSGNTSLTSLDIPRGTVSMNDPFFADTGLFPSLVTLRYNASNSTIGSGFVFRDTQPTFDLVIGEDVDVLPANFDAIVKFQHSIYFEPNNQITVEAGAFASAEEPLASLEGTIYVDDQGILYSYDAKTGTATLVNIPNNVVDAAIPAAFSPEDGVTCTVTGVAQGVAKHAERLKSVTFEEPEKIESISHYAFANCPSLNKVNGATTVEEALASFTEATSVGTNPFYNTGLEGASGSGGFASNMHGKENLTVTGDDVDSMDIRLSSEGDTIQWQSSEGGSGGGYRLLTGDTLNITASLQNTTGTNDARYRVYLRLAGEDATLSITPGSHFDITDSNGSTVASASVFATDDPYTVYLEFAPHTGSTISIPMTALYPSPTSSGGGITIWGVAGVKPTSEGSEQGELIEPTSDDMIQAYWTTQPDSFSLRKTGTNGPRIWGDGEGGAALSQDMRWDVSLPRDDTNSSSYGKDFARSIDFVDTLHLPQGVIWAPDVVEAVKQGTIRVQGSNIYAGDILIAQLSATGISGRNVTWNEEEQGLELSWRYVNGNRNQEAAPPNVSIYLKPEAFEIDLNAFHAAQDKHQVINEIRATVHYTHSVDDEPKPAIAQITLSEATANLTFTKGSSEPTYFGEDIDYPLTLTNTGTSSYPTSPMEGVYRVSDPLSTDLYITPQNMERMFAEAPAGTKLTITIKHAQLGTWEAVTNIDGTENAAWRTPRNSSMDTTDTTLTITAAFNDGAASYTVQTAKGASYIASSVAEALYRAGYAPTSKAVYTCDWALNSEDSNFSLGGGASLEMTVHATIKTTFELLEHDRPSQYPNENPRTISNTAYVYNPNGGEVKRAPGTTRTVRREAVIDKSVSRDGVLLDEAPQLNDDDVLDYRLNFTHYGTGAYENLPMVDDLYGAQYLLVPADENPQLEGQDLEQMTVEGKAYYLLKAGTYKNVRVGIDDSGKLLTAASITVAEDEGDVELPNGEGGGDTEHYKGLHTHIEWYFDELPGEEYRIELNYHAVVDAQLAQDTGSYSVGNMVWMNDKPGNRIFAGLWGGGTILQFEKHIVEGERDGNPDHDILVDHSTVGSGEAVTYRLDLQNAAGGPFTLTGDQLGDALPQTFGAFKWVADDIKIKAVAGGTGNVVGVDDLNNWSVSPDFPSLGVAHEDGQYYIVWPDEARITFESDSTLYLYVTLTFPSNVADDAVWDRYTAAAGTQQLQNTLWLYGLPSTVTHDLEQSGSAFLQKGVYGLYRENNQNRIDDAPSTSERVVYNNRDTRESWVQYYTVIMNTGNPRLYLNDLIDQLPEGFTYGYMRSTPIGANGPRTIVTNGGANEQAAFGNEPFVNLAYTEGGATSDIHFMSAQVQAEVQGDGTLRFTFGSGEGDYAVHYDAVRGQYYLDRNEAIVFGYFCQIGFYSQTEDVSQNTLAMPYEDYLDTGVIVTGEIASDVNVSATGAPIGEGSTYNDGTRLGLSAEEVQERYGITDPSGKHARWLVSDVTLRRTYSVPGVSKRAVSYTPINGETIDYTGSAAPAATINWQTTLRNDGPTQIVDYMVQDTMEAPYTFVGDVTLQRFLADGSSVGNSTTLFTIADHSADDATVNIGGQPVPVGNSEWTVLPDRGGTISVKLDRAADGSESLSIRLQGSQTTVYNYAWMMIPENGGTAVLSYSTRNTSETISSRPYINDVLFEPDCTFSSVSEGTMVRDENGDPSGVRNSAAVNVAFGYVTSSNKHVTEVNNRDNTASATGTPTSILLGSSGSAFTYELEVSNQSESPLNKLVVIDNLPEPDDGSPFDPDASRNSAFKVRFADDPQVSVRLRDPDGTVQTVDPNSYRVEYTAATSFTDADWAGETGGAGWNAAPASARSLRVVLGNGTADVVPAGATVLVSFTANIDGAADPGTIAWNNFGYRYEVNTGGSTLALSAVSLPVGVRVPAVPTLEKVTVDGEGNPVAIAEEATFTFAVYEGSALEGRFDSVDAVRKALGEADRPNDQVREVTLTVNAGESSSNPNGTTPCRLDFGDGWTWTDGARYTITEITPSDSFSYRDFNTDPAPHYGFTYRPGTELAITCRNTYRLWDVTLTKVDGDDLKAGTVSPLAGAVFALYSPEAGDQRYVSDIANATNHPEYQNIGIDEVLDIGEGASRTAYLTDIVTLGASGSHTWENLPRDRYYLLEVKAPNGYSLPDEPGRILYRDSAQDGELNLQVPNYRDYTLPSTGGSGTRQIRLAGLVLAVGAIALVSRRGLRPKGGGSNARKTP